MSSASASADVDAVKMHLPQMLGSNRVKTRPVKLGKKIQEFFKIGFENLNKLKRKLRIFDTCVFALYDTYRKRR